MTKLITKETLRADVFAKQASIVSSMYKQPLSEGSFNHCSNEVIKETIIKAKEEQYLSPYKMALNKRAPVAERISKGNFSLHNPDDLYDFVDATRLDVTRKVLANPVIYTTIYNRIVNPGISKTATVQELLPLGMVFKTVQGTGDSVHMGDFKTGNTATVAQVLKACGYSWDLVFELYNNLFDMQNLNESVARGYAAEVNDSHIEPILSGTYAGAKASSASTVGDTWMEKWYHTILDAKRDMRERKDPISKRELDTSGLILLASKADADDLSWVINGQLNSPADSKNLSTIPGIAAIVGYEGDTIEVGNKTYTFDGVPDGTCFLIKPSQRGFISAWKRDLTPLVQTQGDVLTLSREKHAWYYSRGIYNAEGINSYVQKVTLPTR